MSEHEYSMGIIGDGAAILKNGQLMTPEQIVKELHTSCPEIPDSWTHKLNSCRFHDDDHAACATYSGQVPCDADHVGDANKMVEPAAWAGKPEKEELKGDFPLKEESLTRQGDAEPVAGEMVSVDVSACDEDNGNRVFGEIIDWQDDGSGNRIWLCSLDHYNYPLPTTAGVPEVGAMADILGEWLRNNTGAGITHVTAVDLVRLMLASTPQPQPPQEEQDDE